MTALRSVPRSARQLLSQSAVCSKLTAASFARCASTEAPPVPDVETDSGLMAPIVERKGLAIMDPRKRASQRDHELPHGRLVRT